ncbi:hypothetical protein FB446DRAFT_738399 [Lentinula raphanica]|nr:hypothetical protein FB446DRAFT_738399 [Lentinula raphanica]
MPAVPRSTPTTPRVSHPTSRSSSAASKYRASVIDAALKSHYNTPSPTPLASPLHVSSSSSSTHSSVKNQRTPGSALRLSLINDALQDPGPHTPGHAVDTFPGSALDTGSNSSQDANPLFNDRGLGSDGVLQLHLIESPLRDTYAGVINLRVPTLRTIAVDSVPCEDQDYLSISSTLASLQLHERRALMAVATFERSGGWFNPARADPSYIRTVSNGKGNMSMFPILKHHVPAMCLSVGIVEQCSIVQPATINLNNGNVRTTRDVLVKGFSQDEQRKLAFLADVFHLDSAAIPASAGVMVYSSIQRFENEPIDFKPLMRRTRPPRYTSGDPRLKLYPQIRVPVPFSSQIPIYDGRRSSDTAFECEENQLHEISLNSYPLYQNGNTDLPPGSLVTVGYSVHTYPPKSGEGPVCLSFDLAFLVLMALPPNLPSHFYVSLPSLDSPSLTSTPSRHVNHASSSRVPAVTRHYLDLTTLSTGDMPTTPK